VVIFWPADRCTLKPAIPDASIREYEWPEMADLRHWPTAEIDPYIAAVGGRSCGLVVSVAKDGPPTTVGIDPSRNVQVSTTDHAERGGACP